jgi:3-(3-hydroxy-phenyl)propionate hydroxylase
VLRREANEDALDLYVRQRRAAAVAQVQAMSIRNKRLLEERDPQVQREQLLNLIATAEDADKARTYLLESSMIAGLARANEVQ